MAKSLEEGQQLSFGESVGKNGIMTIHASESCDPFAVRSVTSLSSS